MSKHGRAEKNQTHIYKYNIVYGRMNFQGKSKYHSHTERSLYLLVVTRTYRGCDYTFI